MKYVLITTLLPLLSAIVRSQSSHEVNLVKRLNDFFSFDHNIFLLDSVRDPNRYIPVNDKNDGHIVPQTVYFFDRNKLNYKRLTVNSKNPFLIVVAADGFTFSNDTQILDVMMAIRQIKPNLKVGIFFENNISSREPILQFFKWSWRQLIEHIFCAFYFNDQFNQFRFDPFAEIMQNLTGNEFLQDYYPNKIINYHRRPLRVWGLYDMPVHEFGLTFWQNVAHILNATMTITYASIATYENYGFSAVKADVAAFETNTFYNNLLRLYPQRTSQLMLFVPHAQPYSDFVAYLQSSTWKTLFAYAFFVIATASLLLTVSGYWQGSRKKSIFQCVADVVNLIINDNSAIKYSKLHRADVYIVVPLTFTGLIVVNGILSVFKSYLTVPIYERQIKTIDDLYKSQLQILSIDVFWQNETIRRLQNLSGLNDWRQKVQPTTYLKYVNELHTFNNSIAYSLLDRHVRVCLTVQKRLTLKSYYWITEKFLAKYFVTFPINADYPFIRTINSIHHRFQSAGILDKWLGDIYEKEIKQITKDNLGRQLKSNISDDSSGSLMTVVWCGWIASVVVFICELILYKNQRRIEKVKQTLQLY